MRDGRRCSPPGSRGAAARPTIDLSPGATVVLYTDGLVERRGETFDRGVERLREVLASERDADLDASRATLVMRRLLAAASGRDDVAFLCLRAGEPAAAFTVTLAADPTVLASMRQRARGMARPRTGSARPTWRRWCSP